MSKTNIYDFLVAALDAEKSTRTGKINITVTVLSTAILIAIVLASVPEVIVNGILRYNNKPTNEHVPVWIEVIMVVVTCSLFFLCLYIVSDMEKKKSKYSKTKK